MKQIPSPRAARSIVLWSIAAGFVFVDVFSGQPVGANGYAYSKVDRHCLPGIDRGVAIPPDIAAQIQALPVFSSIEQVVALTGPRVYCQLPPKRVQTPNGEMWGDPYILPIAGTSDVLMVPVDVIGQVLPTEVWNASPEQIDRLREQSADAARWVNRVEQDYSMLPYQRGVNPVQPQPQNQEACR